MLFVAKFARIFFYRERELTRVRKRGVSRLSIGQCEDGAYCFILFYFIFWLGALLLFGCLLS